jgi:hypothetical protein
MEFGGSTCHWPCSSLFPLTLPALIARRSVVLFTPAAAAAAAKVRLMAVRLVAVRDARTVTSEWLAPVVNVIKTITSGVGTNEQTLRPQRCAPCHRQLADEVAKDGGAVAGHQSHPSRRTARSHRPRLQRAALNG